MSWWPYPAVETSLMKVIPRLISIEIEIYMKTPGSFTQSYEVNRATSSLQWRQEITLPERPTVQPEQDPAVTSYPAPSLQLLPHACGQYRTLLPRHNWGMWLTVLKKFHSWASGVPVEVVVLWKGVSKTECLSVAEISQLPWILMRWRNKLHLHY